MITGSDFDAIANDIGSYVDIRLGSVSFDSYGESTTTFTTGSTLAIAQSLSETDDLVKQGTMNVGDIRVFIKNGNTDLDVSAGDDVVQVGWEGFWYEREGFPQVMKVGSFVTHQEILFRKKVSQ